ncbi:MAG: hypothetical protein EPO01_20955 [Aquabacterium sp.]|jgi:hypothetical protein|nr:MAG: hypothetical protein EPO12_05370 [Aquabacterium sp.]TAL13614.1 MAG: hypothetical protein EPO01_20955 [Aquabacterium sp.]
MDPVSRLGQVIALMRARQAERRREAGTPAARAQARSGAAGADDVRERVVRRLHGLDLRREGARAQGVRVFLETVLLHELGEGLVNSPRFRQVLAEVQQALESDPATHAELVRLLADLQEAA